MGKRKLWLALLIAVAVTPVLIFFLADATLKDFEGLHPGDVLPLLPLQTAEGRSVETGAWRGVRTVLVVFQPGCDACRLEINGLESIAPSFPDVRIVLLSTEKSAAGMRPFFPIYVDPDGRFLKQVRKLVTPTIYWFDAIGEVRYARAGQRDAREEEGLFRRLMQEER